MEGYFDFFLFGLINLEHLDWSDNFWEVTLSNIVACIVIGLTALLPPVLMIYFIVKRHEWRNEAFQDKYGALLDGTDLVNNKSKCSLLLIPITFFIRRVSFCLTIVFWMEFFWG